MRNDKDAQSPLQQLIAKLEYYRDSNDHSMPFELGINHAINRARELLPTEQAAPKTDEEIMWLATDAIPVYPIYADALDSLDWGKYIDHLRMEWAKGYKAALQSLEKDRWIAVSSDNLPEQMDMNVLLLHKTYGVFQGYLMQFGEQWASVRNLGKAPFPFNDITHWMPTTAIPLPLK